MLRRLTILPYLLRVSRPAAARGTVSDTCKHVKFASLNIARHYTTGTDLDKEIEVISDLAATAKDEMDFAEESRNSVYYNEDKTAAHHAVDDMTNTYAKLLDRLSNDDRQSVESRIGMKIKEIQAAYEIMTQNDLDD